MAIEKLLSDLAVLSKLSDYPGAQDGLSTDEFKAKFDEAALIIQSYINETLVPAIDALDPESENPGVYLRRSGGTMTGPLNMGGKRLTNLPSPSSDGDAAPRGYVLPKSGGTMTGAINMGNNSITGLPTPTSNSPDGQAANKAYVDSKRLSSATSGTVTLAADGWSNKAQTVDVSGILATDMPHWGVVYSSSSGTREAEKEAFALVDVLETAAGKFTFRCFGDVPKVALNIQWEVNR